MIYSLGGAFFSNPFERWLPKETTELFEEVGRERGHEPAAIKEALWSHQKLRDFIQRSASDERPAIAECQAMAFAWHLCRRPALLVTRGLFDALHATDLTEAPSDAVEATHPVVAVLVPQGCGLDMPEDIRVTGMLVCVDRDLITAAVGAVILRNEYALRHDVMRAQLDAMVPPATIGVLGASSNGAICRTSVVLSNPDLQACIEQTFQRSAQLRENLLAMNPPPGHGVLPWGVQAVEETPRHDDTASRTLTGFALKVLLYAASHGAQIEPLRFPSRPGKRSTKAREIEARTRRRWGTPIVLGRELPELALTDRAGPRPHLVRGHWRWQAHGPQWSLRKLIWIAPFVKGLEGGAGERPTETTAPSRPPMTRDA